MKWQLALGLLLCAALAVAEPSREEKAEAMAALEALSNVDESSMSEEAVDTAKKWLRVRARTDVIWLALTTQLI
uniref:SERPIN domain-containing protein n=1 Tax=Macrostomum lignano TaxID=282301 RepID=A0A1I8G6Q8_9PLAT